MSLRLTQKTHKKDTPTILSPKNNWLSKQLPISNSSQPQSLFKTVVPNSGSQKIMRLKKGQASAYIALRNQKRKRRREKTQD